MSDDDPRPPSGRPAVHLLDELESIKGVLDDDGDNNVPADIPLLDDMVIDNLDNNAKLLDIEQIFDEEAIAEPAPTEPPMQFPRFTLDMAIGDDSDFEKPSSASQRPRVRPDYSRETLIQELVDEFIPQIEAELHKRLQQLDDAALNRLKDSK